MSNIPPIWGVCYLFYAHRRGGASFCRTYADLVNVLLASDISRGFVVRNNIWPGRTFVLLHTLVLLVEDYDLCISDILKHIIWWAMQCTGIYKFEPLPGDLVSTFLIFAFHMCQRGFSSRSYFLQFCSAMIWPSQHSADLCKLCQRFCGHHLSSCLLHAPVMTSSFIVSQPLIWWYRLSQPGVVIMLERAEFWYQHSPRYQTTKSVVEVATTTNILLHLADENAPLVCCYTKSSDCFLR